MANESKLMFRIGGVYRQRNGALVRLEDPSNYWVTGGLTEACAVYVSDGLHRGARRLSDGKAYPYHSDESAGYDLVPGELHFVDGEWASVESKPEFQSLVKKSDYFAEPKRPALTWDKTTPFDPVPGYVVRSVNDWEPRAVGLPSPDLSPSNPLHGSAFLMNKEM